MDFNDKYLETDDLDTLATDLSVIGEALEQRFESEDKMIEVLHNGHLEQLQRGQLSAGIRVLVIQKTRKSPDKSGLFRFAVATYFIAG